MQEPQWFIFVLITGKGVAIAKQGGLIPEGCEETMYLIGYGLPDEVLEDYVFSTKPTPARLKTWRGEMPVVLCSNQFGDEYISLLPVDCATKEAK